MNTKKIIITSLIIVVLLAIITSIVITIKPIMHKAIQLDNIIFVRSK